MGRGGGRVGGQAAEVEAVAMLGVEEEVERADRAPAACIASTTPISS
jgi:hypothetical protein